MIFLSSFTEPEPVPEAQGRGEGAAERCWGRDALVPLPPPPASPSSGWAVSEKLFEESLESPLLIPDSCQN